MTAEQWKKLLDVVDGKPMDPLPVGFIADSPWLPNWAGMTIMDYFSSDSLWFDANLKMVRTFDNAIFLPGFWAEYGMCTEPSAFGARCVWAAVDAMRSVPRRMWVTPRWASSIVDAHWYAGRSSRRQSTKSPSADARSTSSPSTRTVVPGSTASRSVVVWGVRSSPRARHPPAHPPVGTPLRSRRLQRHA